MGYRETLLDEIDTLYTITLNQWFWGYEHWNWLNDNVGTADLRELLRCVRDILYDYGGCIYTLLHYPRPWGTEPLIPYFLRHYTISEAPEAEFNMGILLSTMLTAEPSQIQGFVGITDAYRQSIWNKPFNKEFFAALARGFEQWG